jgi:hypothetical protein
MAKNYEPIKNGNSFTELLESVLVNVWGDNGDNLKRNRIKQTRSALAQIRTSYRFRSQRHAPQPSHLNYKFSKNRAGYLAAFGERHAYLTYLHLKKVYSLRPDFVPQPLGKRNELVVTSLGAGACIELYGLCLYYLAEFQQRLFLKVNAIEKERGWVPNRHVVFARVLNRAFPKLDIDPINIDADLTGDAISLLSPYYDRLVDTDILLIYNVMNEIPSTYAKRVWRNIKFLLNTFQKPVLILLMEPSADKAEPRIHWLKKQLTQETTLIDTKKEEIFYFDSTPVKIELNPDENSLNHKLFGARIDGARPNFETNIQRSHFASVKIPNSPISMQQVMEQLSKLEIKRGRKGKFLHQSNENGKQLSLKM